jgi:hypothetical protein
VIRERFLETPIIRLGVQPAVKLALSLSHLDTKAMPVRERERRGFGKRRASSALCREIKRYDYFFIVKNSSGFHTRSMVCITTPETGEALALIHRLDLAVPSMNLPC